MPSDLEQIQAIKSQSLARIAELTAQPKPQLLARRPERVVERLS